MKLKNFQFTIIVNLLLEIVHDAVFFHDGSNTYLLNNTGNLLFRNDGASTSEEILIQPKGGENSIRAIANGSVELFHNDSKKLETTNTGNCRNWNLNRNDYIFNKCSKFHTTFSS